MTYNALPLQKTRRTFTKSEMIIQILSFGDVGNHQRVSQRGSFCLRQSLSTPQQDASLKLGRNKRRRLEKSFAATFISVQTCYATFFIYIFVLLFSIRLLLYRGVQSTDSDKAAALQLVKKLEPQGCFRLQSFQNKMICLSSGTAPRANSLRFNL